jgi:hypothetical protein
MLASNAPDHVVFPPGALSSESPIFTRKELLIAARWPEWHANARDVRFGAMRIALLVLLSGCTARSDGSPLFADERPRLL